MNVDKTSSPVFATSQDSRVVGNNQTNNKTGFLNVGSESANPSAPLTNVAKPMMGDIAKAQPGDSATKPALDTKKTIGDIVNSMFENILKDGKIDKGEANMVAQLMQLLSDVKSADSAQALGDKKNAGGQPDSSALTAGGANGSQAPPVEEADDGSMALGGPAEGEESEEGVDNEGDSAPMNNEPMALQAGDRQTPNPGRQDSSAKGGTAQARDAYDTMKQSAMADGNISANEQKALTNFAAKNGLKDEAVSQSDKSMGQGYKNLALLDVLKSSLKDGSISKDEFKLISKMVDQGAGKGLSEKQQTAMMAKVFTAANKDGDFSKQDLATFNKLMSVQSSGGAAGEVGSGRTSRDQGTRSQPGFSRALPTAPTNATTAQFIKDQLGASMYPDRGNKRA
jgi:hypothetical protein